jgi:IS1 family transposase
MLAVSRMAGVAKNTVSKLLADIGEACAAYQDKVFRNLKCKRIQCDEIRTFVGKKQKQVRPDEQYTFGVGDVYTWVAIDADTKLVPCWHLGRRDAKAAEIFINDLASRLKGGVQLTTDGHRPYLEAIESAFGSQVDYAMLVKLYGESNDDTRYSPSVVRGARKERITGNPDIDHVSTSYIERQNLTMRMSMRRFTRLTNGFSKKLENHMHAVAVHYMHYNFVRIHKSLRMTPAMAAGVTEHLWEIEDIVKLLDR